ncbi:MAG TPA: type II toxin-antitoxin system HicB family antitoxin [Patescibacteria group bacterium]|jgi:antitoxin HicB
MKNKKNLDYYLDFDYAIRITEDDGSYFAEIEELPGCFTQGETKQEVLEMIEDAKRAWLETALDQGLAIPEPVKNEFSGKLNLRLPKSLHRNLVYRARQEGVSLNTFISTNLSAATK